MRLMRIVLYAFPDNLSSFAQRINIARVHLKNKIS